MALIKHAAAAALPRDAIVLNFAELSEQAAEITRRAEVRAKEIVTEAEAERRRLLDTATAEGFAAGQKAGMEKGLAEGREKGTTQARAEHADALAALEGAWTESLRRFDEARDTMLMHARADVLTLALGVARRVTKRVVETDPTVVAGQIGAVLELITRPTRLTLRVHPQDLEAATREAKALVARVSGARHAEVVADERATRGSVLATTDRGSIDASIETQLDRIIDALQPGGARTTAAPDPADAPPVDVVAPAAADEPAAAAPAPQEPPVKQAPPDEPPAASPEPAP